MKHSPSIRRWGLSPLQIGLGVVWGLFIVAIEVLIGVTYFNNSSAIASFGQTGDAVTNLANSQRLALQLEINTNLLLNDPSLGFAEVDQIRALQSSQLKILVAQANGNVEILNAVDDIQKTLAEFDGLMKPLRNNASPEAFTAAKPAFAELFSRFEKTQIKPIYDRWEVNFFNDLSARMQSQSNAQLILLIVGLLFLISGVALVISVVRATLASAERTQLQIDILEQRVADRTKSLTISSMVSRRLSSIMDKGQLAVEVVEQLQTAFHYYHAHIYLLDASGEKLVMTGGTGETGKALLKQGHSIPRGRGLVWRAADKKEIVLVPDTSTDPNWLPNALLPETKSEIAVPIISGDQVLGVLDVQNNVAESLSQQDADLLSSIADQTAIALHNISSTEETQRLARDYKDLIDNSPAAIAVLDAETGVFIEANQNALELYDITLEDLNKVGPIQLSPTQQPDGSDSNSKARTLIAQALETGHAIFEWTHQTSQGKEFLAEIRLVRVTGNSGRTLLNALMTDITEQRRLGEASRKRAIQQEALNTITQKIQNTTTIEAALQITAREIGHAVGMKTTLVTLDPSTLADNERKVVSK